MTKKTLARCLFPLLVAGVGCGNCAKTDADREQEKANENPQPFASHRNIGKTTVSPVLGDEAGGPRVQELLRDSGAR